MENGKRRGGGTGLRLGLRLRLGFGGWREGDGGAAFGAFVAGFVGAEVVGADGAEGMVEGAAVFAAGAVEDEPEGGEDESEGEEEPGADEEEHARPIGDEVDLKAHAGQVPGKSVRMSREEGGDLTANRRGSGSVMV